MFYSQGVTEMLGNLMVTLKKKRAFTDATEKKIIILYTEN